MLLPTGRHPVDVTSAQQHNVGILSFRVAFYQLSAINRSETRDSMHVESFRITLGHGGLLQDYSAMLVWEVKMCLKPVAHELQRVCALSIQDSVEGLHEAIDKVGHRPRC